MKTCDLLYIYPDQIGCLTNANINIHLRLEFFPFLYLIAVNVKQDIISIRDNMRQNQIYLSNGLKRLTEYDICGEGDINVIESIICG